MTLPSSGALSLNDVRGEFGGPSSNVAINSYYRNGSFVYNVTKNTSVPTSGQIQFNDFYGTEGAGVYAKGTAGTASTGGKASVTYNGVDTVGQNTSAFGSWSDASVTVGSTGRTVRRFTTNVSPATGIPTFDSDFNVSSGSIMPGIFFQIYDTSSLKVDMKVNATTYFSSTREQWSPLANVDAQYGPSSPTLGAIPSSGTIYLICNRGSFT